MEWISGIYWYYIGIVGVTFFGVLWWQNRPTKEGDRMVSRELRWHKDIAGIAEQSFYFLARLNRPLTEEEMSSLVMMREEYYRLSILSGHVIKTNKENNKDDKVKD